MDISLADEISIVHIVTNRQAKCNNILYNLEVPCKANSNTALYTQYICISCYFMQINNHNNGGDSTALDEAMSRPARLQILHVLHERSMTANDIIRTTGFSQSLVSRQLSILRLAGVVDSDRRDTQMLHRITDDAIGGSATSHRECL